MDELSELDGLPDDEFDKLMQDRIDQACAEGLGTPRDVPAHLRWFRVVGWFLLAAAVFAPIVVINSCANR